MPAPTQPPAVAVPVVAAAPAVSDVPVVPEMPSVPPIVLVPTPPAPPGIPAPAPKGGVVLESSDKGSSGPYYVDEGQECNLSLPPRYAKMCKPGYICYVAPPP